MKSIVLELQQDSLNMEIPVTNLLRKAYVVAKKLKLSDFEKWLSNELDGYKVEEKVPEYREMHGTLKGWNIYHGWQPIYFKNTKTIDLLTSRDNGQRVAEIESLLVSISKEGDNLQMPYSAEQEKMICDSIGQQIQVTLLIPSTGLIRIIDAVRNIILNWSLKLEEDGIFGEGMTFSDDEKNKVEQHSYNVNHFYSEVTGSQIQQSSPFAEQKQILKEFSTTNINSFISSLKEGLKNIEIDKEISKELDAEIATIDIQTKSPKPKNGIIKESLTTIRTILEGASGSVAGQLLLELTKLI